jgi:PAS domain S-box-containing protein
MPRDSAQSARASARYASIEIPRLVVRLIGRYYFGAAGMVAAITAMAVAILPAGPAAPWRAQLIVALLTYATACGWGFVASRHRLRRMHLATFLAGLGVLGLTLATALAYGDGLRNPAVGFVGLVVCLVTGVSSLRWGAALTACSLGLIGVLAAVEARGPSPAPAIPLATLVAFQGLIVLGGLAGGVLLSRVLDRYLGEALTRERRFRDLLNLAVDWYWEQDSQFRFTHVSSKPGTGSLIADDERLGQTPWDLGDMGLSPQALAAHRADLEAHRPFSGLIARRVDRQGHEHFLSVSGEPRFDEQGRFRGYWGVGLDITDDVQAQRAIAVSEARYRALFQRSPTALLLHRNGIVCDANDAAARLFGFECISDMMGYDLRGAYHDTDSLRRLEERIGRLEDMAVGDGLPMDEFRMVSRRGRKLVVQATAARVDTIEGPVSLSLYFDVTERVAAEAALRRSQDLMKALIDTSPDCITLTELATGRYELVNKSFERVTGYTLTEIKGRTASDIDIWHNPAERSALVAAIRAQGRAEDMPAVVRCKNGQLVTMRISSARFEHGGDEYLVLNGHDVTAAEQARLEHDAILQNASIGIAFTRNGHFQHTNASFDRMFGWKPGQLAGRNTAEIWPHPDDYDAMRTDATPVLSRGQPYEIERQMLRADGSLFWCRMRGQALDGASPREGTIWIAEDVTERRQVDRALAAARDAAEAASRAKSAFLANTSHEIRTPLNGLLGLARLAMQEDLDEARRRQYLEQIFDSAHSLSEIISDILDLSKIEAGKITLESLPFGLRDTLGAVHDAYRPLAEAKGLELLLVIESTVPAVVLGDPVRVRQILTNFITNAIKFTEHGRVRVHAGRGPDDRIRLSVSDTGPGVDAQTQGRLFLPFSQADDSTTRRYGGTGLGLSICRELARMMGGEVGVVSMVGTGSTFWAELPLPPADEPDSEHGVLDAPWERLQGARVLMVEDNPVNMLVAVAMLEQWGVRVTQAIDGRLAIQAVDEAVRRGEPFDCVLMDVQMPHMSGHEAARELRKRFDATRLPIIALTAAALVSEREQAMASGMNEFLTKPIDATRLKDTLARCIAH